MASRTNNTFRYVDWVTIGLIFALLIFGWMNVLGASWSFDQTSWFDFSFRSGKQLVWIGTALLIGFVILMIDWKLIQDSAWILYSLMLLLLLITPFVARDIKGSLSWISLGPVSIQPAEFAKFTTALALSAYMSRYGFKLRSWRDLLIPLLILGVPMLIIMVMQKETGSALVFASFVLMLYRKGMSGNILVAGMAAVVLFILALKAGILTALVVVGTVTLCAIGLIFYLRWKDNRKFKWRNVWITLGIGTVCAIYCLGCNWAFQNVLQDHQQKRIAVVLGIMDDPQGAGYNVNQSKIAIGSGAVFGKGFLKGTQTKMNFVPEQATDFIFCTIGEEWGFVGSSLVLIVYLMLILRLITIAERQRDEFSMVYAYCIVGFMIFHLTINVGMVLGLMPVIGIPLPLLSYGGSSLWSFSIMLFTLLRLDAARVEKMR